MIGTSLGPYKIIEQLGAGGMGEVYLGEDTRLGRKVAIKVLPDEVSLALRHRSYSLRLRTTAGTANKTSVFFSRHLMAFFSPSPRRRP